MHRRLLWARTLALGVLVAVGAPARAGNVVEDYVDFMGASGSFGLSLKQRELAEAQLRLRLDEKYLQDIKTIGERIKKDRANDLLASIARTRRENARRETYLKRIQATLVALTNANAIIEQKLYVQAQVDAVIAQLTDQKENFLSLTELMQITADAGGLEAQAELKPKRERYRALAEKYQLSADTMLGVAAQLGTQEALAAATAASASLELKLRRAEQTTSRHIENAAAQIAAEEFHLNQLVAQQ